MITRRGQILPLMLVMIGAMAFLWITLLNVGKLMKDRIQMQIAADAAVQSACAIRARGLNSIGLLNKWLGVPVLGIGWPRAAWWPTPPHPMGGRVLQQKAYEIKKGMQAAQKMFGAGSQKDVMQFVLVGSLSVLSGLLGISYDLHPPEKPNLALKQKQFIGRLRYLQERYAKTYGGGWANQIARGVARELGADDIYTPPGSYSLGLQPNRGIIWYLPTMHLWIKNPKVPVPLPALPDPDNEDAVEDGKRWYEQRPDFARKSMRLYVFRRPSSAFNGSFPLGKAAMHIQMPYLYAVAAARVYNPGGPMFPTPRQTKEPFGGTPVTRVYDHASERWQSQLVPVGGLYEH